MGKKKRIYWRDQGGERRAYGDFRDFADVGGKREALIPPEDEKKRATTDPDVARKLAAARVEELEDLRRGRGLGVQRVATLEDYAGHHLEKKSEAGKVTTQWLAETEKQLRRAVEFFGALRDLSSIEASHVQDYRDHLSRQPNGRGGTLSGGTVRHYLNALSNLYRRAESEGYVQPGYNPVASLMEKPTASRREAEWLEVHEAALLLEAARKHVPGIEWGFVPIYPILATFLLTGGRKSEVLGLEVGDVSFERKTITFRPNRYRRLKSETSHRPVPLWPQLEAILRDHLRDAGRAGGLLFPSPVKGKKTPKPLEGEEPKARPITDLRRVLDKIAVKAGWAPGEIRTKRFRHTYCAARLQTLDRGAPVSPFTVSREMGHGGTGLVERIYGHLGTVRHRSEEVEYRPEHFEDRIGERIRAL